ncbi:PQ loop repeat-containing protein 2 [Balamuthia mandrillaris]
MPHCHCYPIYKDGDHYVEWIGHGFHACVYTPTEIAAFTLGLVNIGFWLFAQMPQLYSNWRNGTAEALSAGFLTAWLLGDITNLVGTILTHQLPTQLYTAAYFCLMDILLLSQYGYYVWKNRREKRKMRIVEEGWGGGDKQKRQFSEGDRSSYSSSDYFFSGSPASTPTPSKRLYAALFVVLLFSSARLSQDWWGTTTNEEGFRYGGRVLLGLDEDGHSSSSSDDGPPSCEPNVHLSSMLLFCVNASHLFIFSFSLCHLLSSLISSVHKKKKVSLGLVPEILGDIAAWTSGVLYFTARIPQIIRNYRRKSVEGLSFPMFFCAVMANLCYGLSIILAGIKFDAQFFKATLPYLVGSICVLSESFIIVSQFFLYRWLPSWRGASLSERSGYTAINN